MTVPQDQDQTETTSIRVLVDVRERILRLAAGQLDIGEVVDALVTFAESDMERWLEIVGAWQVGWMKTAMRKMQSNRKVGGKGGGGLAATGT